METSPHAHVPNKNRVPEMSEPTEEPLKDIALRNSFLLMSYLLVPYIINIPKPVQGFEPR